MKSNQKQAYFALEKASIRKNSLYDEAVIE
jgi:hypothetical protein